MHRQEIGKRGGERPGIIGFGVREGPEVHRFTGVQQQQTPQVGLVLEAFDIVPVGPGKQLPVEMSQVISLRVLPIFGEFDRKSVVRTAIESRHETLDDMTSSQFERPQLHQRWWINETFGRSVCDGWIHVDFLRSFRRRDPYYRFQRERFDHPQGYRDVSRYEELAASGFLREFCPSG